ncbi:MAG: hypothetical protein EWM49_05340 [Bacillota bacterium]|jgi:hypothetical protein|nr:MAG: hypothetical protein EWM49_05340 [Bacillota bacterium]
MKKTKIILSLMTLLVLAGWRSVMSNSLANAATQVVFTKDEEPMPPIDTEVNPFDVPGNFEAPELNIDGVMDEAEWNSPEWSSPTVTIGRKDTNSASLKFYRGEKALFAFFTVLDNNLLTDGFANGDPVNRSDSVELYLDTQNDGVNNKGNDIQINIGVHGRTRILTGSDNVWGTWNGLVNFEVTVNGTINDESDTDVGFNVEIMVPYSAINMERDDVIGFSLGAPDRYLSGGNTIGTNYDWFGWFVDGTFIDPQQAAGYMVLTNNQIMTREQYNNLP